MNRHEINTALGMSIRRVRKAKHITQDELSKRVGITRSVLTRYELGQIEMSMTMYVAICDALGVNYADLMEALK